ncbi:MAG: hypothetical protein EZS28_049562 [Streblomastix strix]|uniref:Uncharacterized protein n=1 Tax=Streblomastix strix TaxID=222440 RepID=A0A5J4TB24_9EUKA|nr:MAG: hypothetical protein EZS28_049562 [Streblomastix strix]
MKQLLQIVVLHSLTWDSIVVRGYGVISLQLFICSIIEAFLRRGEFVSDLNLQKNYRIQHIVHGPCQTIGRVHSVLFRPRM